jgi:4-phosphopantoate--beta-alanine ligase
MLEDGDRTIALRAANKFVVAIDLNPLSRTALAGSFTIVDNLIRSIPLMTSTAKRFIEKDSSELERIVVTYSHQQILEDALRVMGHSYQQVIPMLESVAQAIEKKQQG